MISVIQTRFLTYHCLRSGIIRAIKQAFLRHNWQYMEFFSYFIIRRIFLLFITFTSSHSVKNMLCAIFLLPYRSDYISYTLFIGSIYFSAYVIFISFLFFFNLSYSNSSSSTFNSKFLIIIKNFLLIFLIFR